MATRTSKVACDSRALLQSSQRADQAAPFHPCFSRLKDVQEPYSEVLTYCGRPVCSGPLRATKTSRF